jgi:hypothetical protein
LSYSISGNDEYADKNFLDVKDNDKRLLGLIEGSEREAKIELHSNFQVETKLSE